MTSTRRFRHTPGPAAPYHLRAGLLIVLDGVQGSGKTTQLERLREAKERMFRVPPVFAELPADVQSPAAVRERIGVLSALAEGQTVLTERWAYKDAVPDLVLLSLTSFTGSPVGVEPWKVVPPGRRVVLPCEHEGIVSLKLWTAMAERRWYGSCACVVQP